ncbi:hypothetical protein R1T08_03285 [Streptomyces sp. SBC-4]|nr:hypothetical protein [Streptomyces sp. SBC-4]MDV5143349.1 hypothetical protein [Streptomyces sp. SBC-4]
MVAPGEERPPTRNSMNLTVLGHPDLRVGQVATLRGLDDAPAGPLRVNRLVHRFGVRTGYVCEVQLVAAAAGEFVEAVDGVRAFTDRLDAGAERALLAPPLRRRRRGQRLPGRGPPGLPPLRAVPAVLHEPAQRHRPGRRRRPARQTRRRAVRVRPVRAHDPRLPRHAGPACPQPQPRQRRRRRRLALAAHPRRPGTRARTRRLLARPAHRHRLRRQPTGPGVNDLTDAKGGRVIQARGLHILVGTPKLPQVGTRPIPPDDDSVTIEHHTGTTIEIDPEGAVTVRTKGSGIKLTNGTVSLSLDGASVQVT